MNKGRLTGRARIGAWWGLLLLLGWVGSSPRLMGAGMKGAALQGSSLAPLSLQAPPSQNTPISVGEISRPAAPDPLPIRVDCSVPALKALAQKAFGCHGGFVWAGEEAARGKGPEVGCRFSLQATPEGQPTGTASVVGFEVERGGKVLFRGHTGGQTPSEALLKASDAVVMELLGTPGFFSVQLAFVGLRKGAKELYCSNDLWLSHVKQLTQDRSQLMGPRWTPQGTLLYSSYYRSGSLDVFELNPRNGQRSTIAAYKGSNLGAQMSPDGRSIALSLCPRQRGAGGGMRAQAPKVYVTSPRGKAPRPLTRPGKGYSAAAHARSIETSPCFSPDGQTICLVSDLRGKPGLFTVPVEGGVLKPLPTRISGYCVEPAWNPVHADQIAFTAACAGGFQVALYHRNEGQSYFITQTSKGESALEPFWMPDGRHLGYTLRSEKGYQLRLIDTLTGKDTLLSPPGFGSALQGTVRLR